MIKQFIRFVVIGALNTLVDFTIYLLLTRSLGLYYVYSNLVSVAFAGIIAFFLSKHITFQNKEADHLQQSTKFALVAASVFLLNNTVLFALVHWLNVHDILAKIIATGCVVLWSFGWQRFWVFRVK